MILLGVPALPLPTGGVTHVFEVITVLLAAQLVVGRDAIWLPRKWCRLELAGDKQQKFLAGLMKLIERLERLSKPRFAFLFGSRPSNSVFGLLVIGSSVAAFVAPPFTGLDTLPALGGVLISLAVLLEDFIVLVVGLDRARRRGAARDLPRQGRDRCDQRPVLAASARRASCT